MSLRQFFIRRRFRPKGKCDGKGSFMAYQSHILRWSKIDLVVPKARVTSENFRFYCHYLLATGYSNFKMCITVTWVCLPSFDGIELFLGELRIFFLVVVVKNDLTIFLNRDWDESKLWAVLLGFQCFTTCMKALEKFFKSFVFYSAVTRSNKVSKFSLLVWNKRTIRFSCSVVPMTTKDRKLLVTLAIVDCGLSSHACFKAWKERFANPAAWVEQTFGRHAERRTAGPLNKLKNRFFSEMAVFPSFVGLPRSWHAIWNVDRLPLVL